jgi:hypothetical protein
MSFQELPSKNDNQIFALQVEIITSTCSASCITLNAMEQPAKPFDWPSLLQFIFSLLGALSLWAITFVLVLIGISALFDRISGWEEVTMVFLVAAGMFLNGALLLPSAGYALAGLLGKNLLFPPWLERLWRPPVLIIFLPLIILLGALVSNIPNLAWIVLPPLHIFAVGLPVLWLTYLGRRGLSHGSPQRSWGIFASGLIIGPSMILFLELLAVMAVGVLAVLYLSTLPGFAEQIRELSEYINQYGTVPQEGLEMLTPYLSQPLIVFIIFAFIAGVVPIIEEILKPVGVWIFATRITSPSQGFVAGLISGAGFALFENLMLSTLGGDWAPTVLLRIATGLLHIITAGLMGWALSLAWLQGRFFRLAFSFLTVVFIHSFWNALALLSAAEVFGLGDFMDVQQITILSGVGLGGMALLMFFVLLASNRSLRKTVPEPVQDY